MPALLEISTACDLREGVGLLSGAEMAAAAAVEGADLEGADVVALVVDGADFGTRVLLLKSSVCFLSLIPFFPFPFCSVDEQAGQNRGNKDIDYFVVFTIGTSFYLY